MKTIISNSKTPEIAKLDAKYKKLLPSIFSFTKFCERAAILEHDAGMPAIKAALQAYKDIIS